MPDYPLPHNHGQRIEKGLDHMPKDEDFQTVAYMFKQLGDESRIRIFWLLCHCEECVINLSSLVGMSSPAVSHHLRPLRSSNLIASPREGKEVYDCASASRQAQLLHKTIEKVMAIASSN